MTPLGTAMLLMFVLASAITVIAMLRVYANIIGHETDLHDLRNRVRQLQYDRQLYLARMNGQIPEESDVDIIEEPEPLETNAIEAVELASAAAGDVNEALGAHPEPNQAA